MLRFVPTTANGLPQKRAYSHRACESCRKRKKRCDHGDDVEDPPVSSVLQPAKSSQHGRGPPPVCQEREDVLSTRPHPLPRSPRGMSASSGLGEPLLPSASPHLSFTHSPTDSVQHATPRSVPRTEAPRRDSEAEDSRFVGDLNPEGIFLAATSPSTTRGPAQPDQIGVWLSEKPSREKPSRWEPKYYSSLPARNVKSSSIYIPDPVTSRLFLPHLEEQCLSLLPRSADLQALRKIYSEEIHPIFPILDFSRIDALPSHSPTNILLNQAICLAASSSWSSKRFLRLPVADQTVATLNRKEFAQHMSLAMRTSLNLGLVKDRLSLIQIYALLSMFTQFSDERPISAELSGQAVNHLQTLGLHVLAVKNRKDKDHALRVFCCVWALDRLNAAFHGRPVLMHERDFGQNLESSIKAQESSFQLFLRIVLLLDKVIDLYRPKPDDAIQEWKESFPHFEEIVYQSGALRVRANLLATIEALYHAVAILSCRSHSLQELPHSSPSYVRQSLSAVRVTAIIRKDFHGQLSLIPVVPYAVSLALRVFYRELRFTKVPLFRARARRELMAACSILRELGDIFYVATIMADLAQQTLNELDKAYSSILKNHAEDAHEGNVVPPPAETSTSDAVVSEGTDSRSCPLYDTDTSTTDWSVLDSMPDIDIFEHFDPNFDLDFIDAALADDTNPAFPIDFGNT